MEKNNRNMRIVGLPPILPQKATILILGTMPGAASLAAAEYYAHPRNAFWPIMLRLLGRSPAPMPPYAARKRLLMRAGIAVWDVFAACERQGSLDSAIVAGSERLNDIASALSSHPRIAAIAANGGRAAAALRRHWRMETASRATLFLPSTSPANARMSAAEKLAAWRALSPYLNVGGARQ